MVEDVVKDEPAKAVRRLLLVRRDVIPTMSETIQWQAFKLAADVHPLLAMGGGSPTMNRITTI